ncbi:MAG TPA: COX15/CtaA family protein [Vicinamibacterales bacterium]|jgi:heme A synthase
MTRLARFGWGVLVYNLGVIAWGAYVRATRSGAGCGAHWPLCNGEVVPQAPTAAMLVEFSHRATSGLALLFVAVLLIWVWRACAPGHPARRGAAWAMVFMLAEAGVGAALVLFQLVAENASMARALFMSAHLTNTFLLLACLALTAYWLSGGEPVNAPRRGAPALTVAGGALAIIIAGISGAVTALGDTLYPAGSLADALGADFSATSHLLVRLRLLHPAITVVVALGLAIAGARTAFQARGLTRRLGAAVAIIAGVQVLAGFINIVLLAPVWMQMVHLLIADALWIAFVLLAARFLARTPQTTPANV